MKREVYFLMLSVVVLIISSTLLIIQYQNKSDEILKIDDLSKSVISFLPPTPDDGKFSKGNLNANVSIIGNTINNMIWNWNGINYTLYDSNLIFMMNFDNVASLGEGSVVNDISNNNDGVINGASWVSDGRYGGAYDFNGKSTNFINLSNSVNLDLSGKSFSISVWIRPKSWGSDNSCADDRNIIFKKSHLNPGDSDITGFEFRTLKTLKRVNVVIFEEGNSTKTTVNHDFDDTYLNNWIYLTFTYNKDKRGKLYVNGVNVDTDNSPLNIPASTSTDEFYIGGPYSSKCGAEGAFNGSIDEVQLWNKVLTDDEIYQQYASNLRKYDSDKWALFINQSKNSSDFLDNGATYNFYASVNTNDDYKTETRDTVIDSVLPIINISYPSNNSNFNFSNININYTLIESNFGSCWYSNDTMSVNISLINCANINFINWSAGSHNVIIYANDSAGNIGKSSILFNVNIGLVPIIKILQPTNNLITNDSGLDIDYNVNDLDRVDSCWFSNDTFRTNISLINCINITNVIWSEGIHNVIIYANDTKGNIGFSGISFLINSSIQSNIININKNITDDELKKTTDEFPLNKTSEEEVIIGAGVKYEEIILYFLVLIIILSILFIFYLLMKMIKSRLSNENKDNIKKPIKTFNKKQTFLN